MWFTIDTLVRHPYLGQSRRGKLDDVETVNNNLRPGEALSDCAVHAFREIHGHLPDLVAPLLGYAAEHCRQVLAPRTKHGGRHRTPPAVTGFVAQERVQVAAAGGGLVNAHVLAHIVLNQKPIRGMAELIPVAIVTQLLLIRLGQRGLVDVVGLRNSAERGRGAVKNTLLKKPRTRGRTSFRSRQAARHS